MDGFRAVTVPGDGNCLTHAASRCILGIEILYHTLRKEIRAELTRNMAWYQKHVFAMYDDETSKMYAVTATALHARRLVLLYDAPPP